jgi:hypothetical protein
MLDFENIGDKFIQVVQTAEWEQLQEKYNNCNDIYVLGHGGQFVQEVELLLLLLSMIPVLNNGWCNGFRAEQPPEQRSK